MSDAARRRGAGLRSISPVHQTLGISALAALLALAVYRLTLAPGLTWAHWGADGGDWATAAVTGRVAHPPGAPLYLALARLWLRLPLGGDPARQLNALSAVMAAGAVALVAATLLRRGAGPWISLAASLSLAFAPLFWSQALITEVYTAAAFFVAATLYALSPPLPFSFSPSLPFAALLAALAVSVHPTALFLLPVLFFYHCSFPRPCGLFGSCRFADLPICRFSLSFAVPFALGLLPYALLPLFGPWPQPWGDLRTPAGWWDFVSARLYRGYAFALPLADWPRRLLAWASLMARQFTPLGALLVLVGLLALWARGGLGLLVALGLLSLYAVGYDTPDSLVYLVPALPCAALLLGEGLRSLWDVMPDVRNFVPDWAALALPLLLLALNWRALDLRRETVAVDWLRGTLDALPARAVAVTGQDPHTFALWYAQSALGARPDVLVVDRDLWAQPSYRAFLHEAVGREVSEPEAFAVGRPLCYVAEEVVCP